MLPETSPSEPTEPEIKAFTYPGVIPKLGPFREGDMYPSLLKLYGGQSGLEYLQCPVARLVTRRAEGWKAVRDTEPYTIEGPDGSIDCVLLVRGERLHGVDAFSNKRVVYLDPDICDTTGLLLETGFAPLEDAGRDVISKVPLGTKDFKASARETKK